MYPFFFLNLRALLCAKFLFSGVSTQPLFHLPLEGEVARHRRDGGGALGRNASRYKRFYHHSSMGIKIQAFQSLACYFWLIYSIFLCLASAKQHQYQANYLKKLLTERCYAVSICPFFTKARQKCEGMLAHCEDF